MWRAIQWLISYILGGLSFTVILVGCVVGRSPDNELANPSLCLDLWIHAYR